MPWGRMALPQFSESMTTNALLSFTLVALPLLVLFSAITYYVIEKPFFELRRSYLKKKPEVNTNIPAETTAPSPS